MKPKIVEYILGYYVHICYIFLKNLFLENNLIFITTFTPKTIASFMLSSIDNTVSITQIYQGIWCQEALFVKEDI